MSKPITATHHNFFDYAAVAAFLLAPSVLGFVGQPANLSYLAGIVLLLLTLSSDMPLGIATILKAPYHGYAELAGGVVLIALPWLLGYTGNASWFFMAMGAALLLVWFFTNYRMTVMERAKRVRDPVKRY